MTFESHQPDDRLDLERELDVDRLAATLQDWSPSVDVPESCDHAIRTQAHSMLITPEPVPTSGWRESLKWIGVAACLGLIAYGTQFFRSGSTAPPPAINSTAPISFARGDINGDGITNILDAMQLDALLAMENAAIPDASRSDMNRDGRIDAADVDAIAHSVVALHVVADVPEAG